MIVSDRTLRRTALTTTGTWGATMFERRLCSKPTPRNATAVTRISAARSWRENLQAALARLVEVIVGGSGTRAEAEDASRRGAHPAPIEGDVNRDEHDGRFGSANV